MDENQNTYGKINAATVKKFHDSGGGPSSHGCGDKHYAKVRATVTTFQSPYINVRRLSPALEFNRYSGKGVCEASNNCSRKAVSSFTKQFLEQTSIALNSRSTCSPRKRQAKTKHQTPNGTKSSSNDSGGANCRLTVGERNLSPLLNVAEVKPIRQRNQGAVCGHAALMVQPDITAWKENHADTIEENKDAVISAEPQHLRGATQLSSEKCLDCSMIHQAEEKLPENEEFSQHCNFNACNQHHQRQQTASQYSAAIDSNSNFSCANFFNTHNCAGQSNHVGSCFSCSDFQDSVPINFGSQNLRRNCTSAYQFHSSFSRNSVPLGSEYSFTNASQSQFQNETPDITIESDGKCTVNSCLATSTDGRYYNIQGFEVTFYQSDMPNINFERSIRIDFSTLGFMDAESFETEVDDKGNIFVLGNVYSIINRLWISAPHCQHPDKIIVEHPAPYYFTIEIPCKCEA